MHSHRDVAHLAVDVSARDVQVGERRQVDEKWHTIGANQLANILLIHDQLRYEQQQMVAFGKIRALGEHGNQIAHIGEDTDRLVMTSISDGHRLQTDTAHFALRRQQETVVDVIEELVAETAFESGGRLHHIRFVNGSRSFAVLVFFEQNAQIVITNFHLISQTRIARLDKQIL